MAALMLLLNGLDEPFHDGVGGLQPVAMERSLRMIDEALGAVGAQVQLPCDALGKPVSRVTAAARRRDRVELVATVLLALATVATAWSGYQSTRWNGEQAKAGGARERAADRVGQGGGAREHPDGDRRRDLHAVGQRLRPEADASSPDFYFKRFRPEFRPAVDAWIATRPLKNPNAPLTPFAMPQYKLAARAEAERLEAQAEVYAAQVRANIQRASNYVLGVVLFASALFFAGMSTKLTSPRLRVAMLVDRLRRLPRAPPSGSRPRRSASPSERLDSPRLNREWRRLRALGPDRATVSRIASATGKMVEGPRGRDRGSPRSRKRARPTQRCVGGGRYEHRPAWFLQADDGTRTHDLLHGKEAGEATAGSKDGTKGACRAGFCPRAYREMMPLDRGTMPTKKTDLGDLLRNGRRPRSPARTSVRKKAV